MAETRVAIVNPSSLGKPHGFNHGVVPEAGRLLFVAGQPGHDRTVPGPPPAFAEQFARALDRVLAVVREAGGEPIAVVRLTIYVTDLKAYLASRAGLGGAWRERFGGHYPAMTLVEVKGLVDEGAIVEIEATAMIGARA
jgi:enamine deaminase RidA (YjgF/YER057c/UK114 family)